MDHGWGTQGQRVRHGRSTPGQRLGLVVMIVAAAVVSGAGLTATAMGLDGAPAPGVGSARAFVTSITTPAASPLPKAATPASSPAPPLAAPPTTTTTTSPGSGAKPVIAPTTTTTVPTVPSPTTTRPGATTTVPTGSATTTTTSPGSGAKPATAAPSSPSNAAAVTTPATPPSATTTTTSAPPVIPSDCSTDVSAALDAYLAALPSGAVFSSPPGACYLVNEGIRITHPIVLFGGELKDDGSVVPPRQPGKEAPSLHPIILIKDTSGVTIDDMSLVGANPGGGYHAALVGQSGIDVRSSSEVTINDVTTLDTYGDGLTLFLASGAGTGPDKNVSVNGLTVTRAGRQGITPAYVYGATFSNVDIVSAADNGWDFESDLPNVGTGDITITHSTWSDGVNMIEPLTGPVTFDHDTGSGHFRLDDALSDQPVSVLDSTLYVPPDDHGDPPAGITQRGGQLTFTDVTIGRTPSAKVPTGPAWSVTDGGHLTFDYSPVTAPLGTSVGNSTVTIVK